MVANGYGLSFVGDENIQIADRDDIHSTLPILKTIDQAITK